MPSATDHKQEQVGTDGWLLLVPALLTLSIIRLCISITTGVINMFLGGTWAKLTSRASHTFDERWLPLIITEFAIQIAFLFAAGALLRMFWLRHRHFPRYAIAAVLASLMALTVDFFVANEISQVASDTDPRPWIEIVMSVVVALIAVPYLCRSKRIRATFTK